MAGMISRRSLLTTAALGASAMALPAHAAAQGTAGAPKQDLFYRDDYFGEPWLRPDPVLLIHGNDESSLVWYGWMPRMAKDYRVIRPDLPAFGQSRVPPGFVWSLPNLAGFVAQILDKAGIESAHIVGAKTGGSIAMQFAADYPLRTRSLSVVSGPASVIAIANPSPIPQRDRLGSSVSKEMIDYWNMLFATAPVEGIDGLHTALARFDLVRDGVLQRIKAPSLVITSDRSALQSVDKVRTYQQAIPNSRLVVIKSDAYHIAAANADECVTNVLAFIRETKQKG